MIVLKTWTQRRKHELGPSMPIVHTGRNTSIKTQKWQFSTISMISSMNWINCTQKKDCPNTVANDPKTCLHSLHHPNQKQNCTRSNYKTPASKQGIGPICTFTTDPSKRNRQIAGNCGNSKVGAFNLRSWRTFKSFWWLETGWEQKNLRFFKSFLPCKIGGRGLREAMTWKHEEL